MGYNNSDWDHIQEAQDSYAIRRQFDIDHGACLYGIMKLFVGCRGDVLDVGCGKIDNHYIDGSNNITGIDPLHSTIDRFTVLQGHAECMPFEDNSFDAVVAASSLDHVKDVNKALSEITRVMKPDAHFYLYSSVWNTPTIDKRHTYSWTSDELFELLGEYFIVNRYIWYVNTLTIPVLFYDGITEDT